MEAVVLEKSFVPAPAEFSGEPGWLAGLRRDAFGRFESLGFPSAKDEAWRYTGLQPITETPWRRVRRAPRLARPLPDGVRLLTAGEAEGHLGGIADFERNAFAALNTALFEDALLLEIRPGAVIADPIEILFEGGETRAPEVLYRQVLILAGERSEASVVETYLGTHLGTGLTFTNAVTEIVLSPGAILEHTKL